MQSEGSNLYVLIKRSFMAILSFIQRNIYMIRHPCSISNPLNPVLKQINNIFLISVAHFICQNCPNLSSNRLIVAQQSPSPSTNRGLKSKLLFNWLNRRVTKLFKSADEPDFKVFLKTWASWCAKRRLCSDCHLCGNFGNIGIGPFFPKKNNLRPQHIWDCTASPPTKKQSHLHGHDQRAQHTQCQDGSRAPLAP